MDEFHPDDSEVPEGCSDRAYAAFVLAKLGDRTSLPAIEALAKAATGEDKKILDAASARLAEK